MDIYDIIMAEMLSLAPHERIREAERYISDPETPAIVRKMMIKIRDEAKKELDEVMEYAREWEYERLLKIKSEGGVDGEEKTCCG